MSANDNPRLVSLVPSVTETLVAWGVDPIACTRFCEQPTFLHMGGTKDPDIDGIIRLKPYLVIMDREENRQEDYLKLVEAGVDVEAVHVASLADVSSEIGRLARRLQRDWSFETPEALPDSAGSSRYRAFVPIWKRPWMTIGQLTYGASVLRYLGVDVEFSDREASYPVVGDLEIRSASLDFVLAPTEPYPFGARHLDMLSDFAPAYLIDGQDLFWWGSRTADALGRLRTQIDEIVSGN